MAYDIGTLRNMFRMSPGEKRSHFWEPMPLSTSDRTVVINTEVEAFSPRSSPSEELASDSARECRRRGGYMCVDSDDLEDPAMDPDEDDVVELPLEPLPESIYGFAIASLVQDSIAIHEDPQKHALWTIAGFCGKTFSLRRLRIGMAFLLCLLTFAVQVLLITETKRLVTPIDVRHIRKVYGLYEHNMYEDVSGMDHTVQTVNGFARGVKGYFNATNFHKMAMTDKEMVCRVPLSQPLFCFMVLYVWALTVFAQIREILNTSLRILALPNIHHEAMNDIASKGAQGDGHVGVLGLTLCMKGSILCMVQIPRLFMTCALLWLGGRWLIATVGFGELVLNCVALEFILNLAGLLYTVLVPYSGKILVQKTHLPHLHAHEHENCANMFGMLGCGFFACILVWLYMYYFQSVLPDYHWDVREVCVEFLRKEASRR